MNENTRELASVFIADSTCGACRNPDLPAILERLKILLESRAREHGFSFAATGIAVDLDAAPGIEFLQKFGQFNEVISGNGYLGVGCRRYLQDIPGQAATPQVLVVSRNVIRRAQTGATVDDERAILRKVGLVALRDWRDLGAPLPNLGSVVSATHT